MKPKLSRLYDILLATGLLLAASLPVLVISVAVFWTSPGPVIFRQRRFGKDGRIFTMYKFRTMKLQTPQIPTHMMQDPSQYVTSAGRFLRRWSLDELPQLVNILRGDMTFVGPRPALYNQEDLMEMRREAGVTHLRPGLTGWAQINGRDDLSLKEKVKYEEFYASHRSFALDLNIVLRTILYALAGHGLRG